MTEMQAAELTEAVEELTVAVRELGTKISGISDVSVVGALLTLIDVIREKR